MSNLPTGYNKTQTDISPVVDNKPSLLSTFIVEDMNTVWSSVWMDILVPSFKEMISRAVSAGIDTLLFGTDRPARRSGAGAGYVSYTSYYNKAPGRRIDNLQPIDDGYDRDAMTRAKAKEILGKLEDQIDKFGQASVADYYDARGMIANFTDYSYGWKSLRSARIVPYGRGYTLELPKAELLD